MYGFAPWYMDGGPGQGCQRLFLGEAEGVTVESTGPVDDNTVVAFYSSSTCDLGTAIGESNAGCVSVDDSISPTSHSMSFNLTLGSNAAREDGPTPGRLQTLLQLSTLPRLQTLGNNLIDSLHPHIRSHASMVLYPTIKVNHISGTRLLRVRGGVLHLKTGTTASTLGTIQ